MNRFFVLAALFAANVFVWGIPVPNGLVVSVFDVGQGRTVLIQGPKGAAVLVDGGPDSSVLRGIGNALPFFARSLDAVIESDPDSANIGGLPAVFDRYRAGLFIEPGVSSDTKASAALATSAAEAGAKHLVARRGMRIFLGKGAYADVLYPDADVSKADAHSGSIVLHIVYGSTSFLLSGDATTKVQKHLLSLDPAGLTSDVILAPHYGSKGSALPAFAEAVAPRYTVFSASCDNRWGYPVPEAVSLFERLGAETLTTCKIGTMTFRSDGISVYPYLFQ